MRDDAENKARRRRSLRESFPAPLNQIALRHVDAVQSLDADQKGILANTLAKMGVSHLGDCLATIKSSGSSIKSDSDLIAKLNLSKIPISTSSTDDADDWPPAQSVEAIDTDYLASLLVQCYPDMPQATADALVGSDVMTPSLQVVSTTRCALSEAKSDFVITALYMLFEARLNEIERIIAGNPAFLKAMRRSRPAWKPN